MSDVNLTCGVQSSQTILNFRQSNFQGLGWVTVEPVESGEVAVPGTKQVTFPGPDPVCLAANAILWADYWVQYALRNNPTQPDPCPNSHIIEEPCVGIATWEKHAYEFILAQKPAPNLPSGTVETDYPQDQETNYWNDCPSGSGVCTGNDCPRTFTESDFVEGSGEFNLASGYEEGASPGRKQFVSVRVPGETGLAIFSPTDPTALNSQGGYTVDVGYEFLYDEIRTPRTASCIYSEDCYTS